MNVSNLLAAFCLNEIRDALPKNDHSSQILSA